MKFKSIIFFLGSALLLQAGFVQSAQNDPNACYESKDKECLEAMYKDIVDNPAPEKSDAIYLLGLLYLDEENYEAAKKQFEIGSIFGDKERSTEKLVELIESGKVEITTTDCLAIGTEECFLNVAKNSPKDAGAAYYLLAGMLYESDAERSAEYTIKAAELGHRTAECLLAYGYGHENASGPSLAAGFVPELPKDYEKARFWGTECGFGPYVGYDEKHFKKYEAANNHRAYAKSSNKYGIFITDLATPEIAASIAGMLCDIGSKRQPDDEECLIVSVDGEWVDYFVAQPLPERVGAVEDLLQMNAREDFVKKYQQKSAPKVFVQGPFGNWSWRSRNADVSIEEVTRLAIESCQNGWLYQKFDSACEVVNVNGKWVK